MNHGKNHQANLLAYVDGELPRDEAVALERHLAECPDCAEKAQQLKESFTALDFGFQSQPHFRTAANPLHAIENRVRNRSRRRWAAATAGIAASAACAVILMTGVNPAANPTVHTPTLEATAELQKVDESLASIRQLLAEYEPASAPSPRRPAPKIYAGPEESAAVILAAGRHWEDRLNEPHEARRRYQTVVSNYGTTFAAADAEVRLQRMNGGVQQ